MRPGGVSEKVWDVVVVGGGPAGMMAAGRAAELGKRVILLEKNPNLGKKLLITGGGRCNITNNKTDVRSLVSKYKGNGKFLFSAFSHFAVSETVSFFQMQGLQLKEEAEGRMFPITDKAESVFEALYSYLKIGKVKISTKSAVVGIIKNEKDENFTVLVSKGHAVTAKACILATGGTSRPETGSTGEGFKWLQKLGHTVKENNMALVPVALKDSWVKKLGGVSLPNVKLSLVVKGEKQSVYKGKLLFTHFGISGPAVLNMSRDVGEALQYESAAILMDLFPEFDPGALKKKIYGLLEVENNKKLKNTLSKLVPSALVGPLLEISGIDGNIFNHSVSRTNRLKLVSLFKGVLFNVKGLLGSEKAIISSGGVELTEVDFKTMQSRIVPGLYLVGDVLNIDRPSGGYSLQLCWTTGFVAGSNA